MNDMYSFSDQSARIIGGLAIVLSVVNPVVISLLIYLGIYYCSRKKAEPGIVLCWIVYLILLNCVRLPHSRKFWRGIKFGDLAVCLCNCQIKIRQYFLLGYIRMVIPYRTAKFKSANIFAMVI